jgi:hypothetical protein
MSRKPQTRFDFQVSRRVDGDGTFPGAVRKALTQFQSQVIDNMKKGSGTVLTAVATPEPGAYFAVVLAGPFSSLEALKDALDATIEQQPLVAEMIRLGLV